MDATSISGSSSAADNVEANIGNLDATISSRSDFDETADPVELLDSGGSTGTSAAELIADILAEVVESQGSITFKEALQIMISALAGVPTSGGKVLKTPNGSATRITMTIDTTNNERDTVTLNFS